MHFVQAAAVVLCLATLGPAVSLAADIKHDVEAAYASFNTAFNKGDAKAVAAAYAPDAKVLPPSHDVASGPADIEKFFAGLFAGGFTDHKLEIVDVGGDDKVVFGAARWSAKGKGADGTPQNFGGLATHVFERQADGALKLKVHTFN
jgi:uncharacterized protein (TIGR02246 family)